MKISEEILKKDIEGYLNNKHQHIDDDNFNDIYKIITESRSKYIDEANTIKVIGSGGNGIVFEITNSKGITFCLKCLYNKKDEREVRFFNEIKAMKELSEINGILPIIDDGIKEGFDYYVMPLCKRYSLTYDKTFLDKIEDLIRIGEIIKNIHDKNIAHRDIKINNILILDNKIYLSDFGLVKFINNDDNITKSPIGGPRLISPPEFQQVVDDDWDYRYSDVYLFSKIVWQVLTKSVHGFWGEYTINRNNYISIDRIKDCFPAENIVAITPINEMLLNTTSSSFKHRKKYDISYCIKKLEEEKNIFEWCSDGIEKMICKDDINIIKFYNHENTSIVSFEPEVRNIIRTLIKNKVIKKELKYYTIGKEIELISLMINDIRFEDEILYIELLKNRKIIGKVRYIISDSHDMKIILMFDNVTIPSSTIKRIENFNENEGEYLLDSSSEIIISFD